MPRLAPCPARPSRPGSALQRDRRGCAVGEVRRTAGRRADAVAARADDRRATRRRPRSGASAGVGGHARSSRSATGAGSAVELGVARPPRRRPRRRTRHSVRPRPRDRRRAVARPGRVSWSSFMSITLRECGSLTDMSPRAPDLAARLGLERHPLAPRLAQALAGPRERGIRPGPRDAEHLGELRAVEALPRVQEQDPPVAFADALRVRRGARRRTARSARDRRATRALTASRAPRRRAGRCACGGGWRA